MGFVYVIEHMEDDDETAKAIPPWVELEYAHMRMLAGSDAKIHFTHLSKASRDSLSAVFVPKAGLAEANCHQVGVLDLIRQQLGGDADALQKVCLLDPKAELPLSPEDGDGRFEWFLFGGILGDDPPRDRTSELRVLGFPTRHLGPVQMTTDTALGVTKLVVSDKTPLDDIPYVVRCLASYIFAQIYPSVQNFPTIVFNPKESVEMPFRYIAEGSEPKLPPGMRELLHEDLNKSFDF
ncbi:SAM-dependent RNA methyltransferase [Mycena alexandri]|uniref:SAM-dependent RNA methyltransferase n=1 Tax=Mycena alexandri TaxID=1745969 RepID=A0AAD6SPB1_9AGAR|nr:SAM-dependent RNA methyltransferase [Mycena alexandri]